jgi:outer membrane protein OmpA-like peptidoglycan-associated protein
MGASLKRQRFCAGIVAVLLAGCASPPPAPPQPFLVEESAHQQIRTAARAISVHVAPALQSYARHWQGRRLVVGNFVNASTAEITASGQELHTLLLLYLRNELPELEIGALSPNDALTDAIVIQGFTRYEPHKGKEDGASWFRVTLGATDVKDERKVGEAAVLINARHFDPSPSRFFRDAPMYLTGTRHRARMAGFSGKKGQLRALLQNDAALNDAIADYEKGEYRNAEEKFTRLIKLDPESDLSAYSGVYQSLSKQGRQEEAEQAFAKLIERGIAEGNLSVRFLFAVRSTSFRDDSDFSAQYTMWVRQIARQIAHSGQCVEIGGHTSKTGKAEFNERLSLQRAQEVMHKLLRVEPRLKSRLRAQGKGFRENIIGSGTDDALDAIDRRVDFVLAPCRDEKAAAAPDNVSGDGRRMALNG